MLVHRLFYFEDTQTNNQQLVVQNPTGTWPETVPFFSQAVASPSLQIYIRHGGIYHGNGPCVGLAIQHID